MGFFVSNSGTKCKECGIEFSNSQRLDRHQERAHKKKETCRTCGAQFNYQEELRKHKKKCK